MADVGIYSGKWFFDAYLPGVTEFSYLPLWAAQYDGVPDASVLTLFGGWGPAQVAIKQYAGTSTLCGVGNVDLDVLSESETARLAPATPEPTWDVTWGPEKTAAVVGTAGELVSVADQLLAEANRKAGPRVSVVRRLAGDVRQRADGILA